ncbi:MAG: hypothetical protein KBS68_06265 [Clostridiales bacterium]|nr:hypothetical protein [Candidatus Crickella merdequi]
MKQVNDIHFEFQTKNQLYKFTDTSLFINYKEYPYKDLTVKAFHEGNAVINAWYELETASGKKLIVAYKPKRKEIGAQLKTIFKYIASFDQAKSDNYHANHKEFEFIVDGNTAGDSVCKTNTTETILGFINRDKTFVLADEVLDGEIQLDETDPDNIKVEIYMYNINGDPVHIGYVPDRLMQEMSPYLEEGITYELRMLATRYGIAKKTYIIRALLIFDRRK